VKRFLILCSLLLAPTAWPDGLVRENFEGVRPTGMGNAFLALSDDNNVMWYNPAALTKTTGLHGNIFDFTLGADSLETVGNVKNAIFNGNYSGLISPDSTFVRFDVKPSFFSKYFGFSLYTHTNGYWDIQSLQLPSVDVYAYSDVGAITAMAFPVSEYFSFGFSLRGLIRSGADIHLDTLTLLQNLGGISQAAFMEAIYDELKKMSGYGYGFGLNLGSLATIPLGKTGPRLQLAATIEDVGQTTFKQLGSSLTPPAIPMSFHSGMALIYDVNKRAQVNFTADVRHMFEPLPFVKTAHLGLEYRHKYFALRTGLSEGYLTYGFSWTTLPHTQIHFSSYAAEVGNGWQQRSQRFFLVQAVIGFNPF
jgi:hypothetical protein